MVKKPFIVKHINFFYKSGQKILGKRLFDPIVLQTAGRTFIAGESNLSADRIIS
jgi:hypothetical protein